MAAAAQKNALYLISVKTPSDRMAIQFVPKELSLDRSIDIEEIKIVGRNNPLYQYSTGTTELSFELDFYAEEESREDVIRRCRWLESFAYADGSAEPPDQLKLVFGKLFKAEVWVLKSISSKVSNFHGDRGMLPQQAYVRITLALNPKFNLKKEDVRNGIAG